MTGVILRWVLTVFALGSGFAKVYGIDAERTGAADLEIPYLLLRCTGVVHLIAAALLASGRPLPGAMLLGASYLPFIYLGFARGQPALAWGALVVMGITLLFTWLSASPIK